MKALCCGAREWANWDSIYDFFERHEGEITCVVQGMCRGADVMCRVVAQELGIEVKDFPAKWDKYGKAAGAIRNVEMIEQNPDLVVAFHSNLKKSKGTKNMVELAVTRGVPVERISE